MFVYQIAYFSLLWNNKISIVFIIRKKFLTSVVVTGNRVHPIHFALASPVVCWSLEILLYFVLELLKTDTAVLCQDTLTFLALGGPCQVWILVETPTLFLETFWSFYFHLRLMWIDIYSRHTPFQKHEITTAFAGLPLHRLQDDSPANVALILLCFLYW